MPLRQSYWQAKPGSLKDVLVLKVLQSLPSMSCKWRDESLQGRETFLFWYRSYPSQEAFLPRIVVSCPLFMYVFKVFSYLDDKSRFFR
jgi:hypothetical protein